MVKSNGLYLWPSKSNQDPIVVMKFEFCAHSAKMLRKLGHIFLWILSNSTGLTYLRGLGDGDFKFFPPGGPTLREIRRFWGFIRTWFKGSFYFLARDIYPKSPVHLLIFFLNFHISLIFSLLLAAAYSSESIAVLKKVKKIAMTSSNVLPSHHAPRQASPSQDSRVPQIFLALLILKRL